MKNQKQHMYSIIDFLDLLNKYSALIVAIFSIFAFFSWRTSVKILDQQRRAELIQNRPYVSMNDAMIKKRAENYQAWFSIKNEGNTPAYSVEISNYYSSNKIKEIIGGAHGGSGGYLGPHQSWKFSLDWSDEQLKKFLKGSNNYYVLEINYFDYLGHKYTFSSDLDVENIDQHYEFFIKNQAELKQ